jgi:hypothetical protein
MQHRIVNPALWQSEIPFDHFDAFDPLLGQMLETFRGSDLVEETLLCGSLSFGL